MVSPVREIDLSDDDDEDDDEAAANRILDAFGIDVRTDDQFDALCDVIEEGRGKGTTDVCRLVANANLPGDVATAVLMTLLNDRFRSMRDKLAEVAAAKKVTDEVLGPRSE